MKAIDIKWDIDANENDLVELPTEVEIPMGITDEDEISDWLTDNFGFCHKGFSLID